jgi:hypothetical protein
MKLHSKILIATLALAGSAAYLLAQDAGGGPPRYRGPGGPDREGHRPPPPPIIAALDANHDGVIDETEIANASTALKTLDKNGDGKLTMDELRPPRPAGRGPRGPDGEGRPPHGPPPGEN